MRTSCTEKKHASRVELGTLCWPAKEEVCEVVKDPCVHCRHVASLELILSTIGHMVYQEKCQAQGMRRAADAGLGLLLWGSDHSGPLWRAARPRREAQHNNKAHGVQQFVSCERVTRQVR